MNALITKIKIFFQETLWQDSPEQANIVWRSWIYLLRISYIMVNQLATGNLSLRAMSLVYTSLLSLVPLIAVVFSVLKAFGVHNQMEPAILNALEPLGEQGVEITHNIIGFVQNIDVRVLGTVGMLALLYTVVSLIQKVEAAFNAIWQVNTPRTWTRRFTDYLSVVMIGPVLVFTALGFSASALNNDLVQSLQAIEPFGTLIVFIGKMVPYVMIILAFTFLYKFIPNTKVKFGPAVVGAIVAGVIWLATGKIFASFVASSSNYTAIYSSFAILFFFMIWLYLSWFVLLLGSQVAFYLQHPRLVRVGGHDYRLSPYQREKEGLWLMCVIAKQFYQQQPALSVEQLGQQTGLSNKILQRLIMMLERGELIVQLEGDTVCYQPAQDIEAMQVSTILKCLNTAEESGMRTVSSMADPRVEHLLQRLEQAQDSVLIHLSLREFIMGKT